MAIAFVAGTTAEIIKLSPIMRALQDQGRPYELWNTAHHVDGFRAVLDDLGLAAPDEHLIPLKSQTPIVRASQVPGWTLRVLAHALRHRRTLRRRLSRHGRPLVIVHGDTFTTVLGALIGRMFGVTVAHVEAGMRSGNVLHPLPEELNRRVVARLARLHFAPTAHEVANLSRERGVRGEFVDTGANTAVDALRLMMNDGDAPVGLPKEFGLVTLHRFEMLRNTRVFTETLEMLAQHSRSNGPLVMVAGDTERSRIGELGLERLFGETFHLLTKLSYPRFLPVLAHASYVVTDSGGLQQECAVLGKPCAVHREATESHQGLGKNLVLTRLDMDVLSHFLSSWEDYRRPSELDKYHPTEIILDVLRRREFLPAVV